MITGAGAYSRFKFESGVHRVQRVPETEAGGRISQFSGASASLTEKCSILAANPRAWQEFFDRGFDVL